MPNQRRLQLLTTIEAAEYLRLKPHTLGNMRWQGTGPFFLKLGGRVLSPPCDIPNVGRFAMLEDPQGAAFSVLQSMN